MSVQTDGASLLVFREQVVHEVEDGRIPVMTLFGEQVRHSSIRFRHQIVYDDEVPRRRIEQRRVWQALL